MGERLGFPIYPVRSAKHFFARYIPRKPIKHFKENIEATNGGGYISDEQYKNDVLIPDRAVKNGVYLRTLTKKQYLASLLLINADEYLKRKNIKKAERYFLLSIKYDSTFSSAYWNYGLTALGEAKVLEAEMKRDEQNIYVQTEMPDKIMTTVNKQTDVNKNNNAERQIELTAIEEKYKPLILKKLKVYKEYTRKAEKLGIVHEFPVRFFQKQMESIKKFKQKGGY